MNYYEYTPGSGGGGGGAVSIISPIPLPVTTSAGSPIEITGSVYVMNPGGAGTNVTIVGPIPLQVTSSVASPVIVSGTLTVTASAANPLPVSGTIVTTVRVPGTGSFTSANIGASNTLVLASNTNRNGAMIFNTTTTLVYVAYGFTATLSNYSTKLPANGMLEVPYGYYGIINAIAASAGPFVLNVTEFT